MKGTDARGNDGWGEVCSEFTLNRRLRSLYRGFLNSIEGRFSGNDSKIGERSIVTAVCCRVLVRECDCEGWGDDGRLFCEVFDDPFSLPSYNLFFCAFFRGVCGLPTFSLLGRSYRVTSLLSLTPGQNPQQLFSRLVWG